MFWGYYYYSLAPKVLFFFNPDQLTHTSTTHRDQSYRRPIKVPKENIMLFRHEPGKQILQKMLGISGLQKITDTKNELRPPKSAKRRVPLNVLCSLTTELCASNIPSWSCVYFLDPKYVPASKLPILQNRELDGQRERERGYLFNLRLWAGSDSDRIRTEG